MTDTTPAAPEQDIESQAKQRVLNDKKESVDYYDEKFKTFNYFDRLYIKGAAKRNTPFGRANLELPLAFQQIEPFVSQMSEMMFGETPYITFVPHGVEDEEVANQITNFVQYQAEQGTLVPIATSYLRNLGKYGTAVMKVAWETSILTIQEEQTQSQPVIDATTGLPVIDPTTDMPQLQTQTITTERDVKQHDGPKFYNISIFDFFVPRSATDTDIQKLDWCIHRTWRSPDEILSNPNYTKNRDKLKQYRDDTLVTANASIADTSKKTELDQKNSKASQQKYTGKIEVLEWWGDFRFTKDGPLEAALIVVANVGDDCVLLRFDRNPFKFKFKPFVASNDYPIEGEFYGYGELHHIKGLVEESTALRNARLDVANISLNRVWLIERQSGVNARELYTAPNHVIWTNDLNGMRALDMAQVTPSSVNELARIDFDIQNTTDIVNPRQDVSNVGAAFGGTATGVNYLSGRTNRRLATKARLLEETFFRPLALILNWYNKDLLTEETYFRVENTPSPYNQIGPEAFLTDVDFRPVSAPERVSRLNQREDMSYMLQVIAQIEKVAPGTSNLPEILKQTWKTTGFPHAEKYVKSPPVTLLQLPNGQMVDQQGQPPNIVPTDETGKPVQLPGGPSAQ